MVGGVAIEHTHRLLGALVGLLTIGVAALAWRASHVRRLAVAAVILVVAQGVLGGVTVLLQLSAIVSTAHLAAGLAFVALLWIIGLRCATRPAPGGSGSGARRWLLVATAAVYTQAIVGGLVRHTGAAAACGADPFLCGGVDWFATGPTGLHMIHRLAALAVATIVILATVVASREGRRTGARGAAAAAIGASGLVLAQIALGVASVAYGLTVPLVTAHLTVAALLLLTLITAHRLVSTSASAPETTVRTALAT
jgi:cytochrome c oxidase assembly protein subunit 15